MKNKNYKNQSLQDDTAVAIHLLVETHDAKFFGRKKLVE